MLVLRVVYQNLRLMCGYNQIFHTAQQDTDAPNI